METGISATERFRGHQQSTKLGFEASLTLGPVNWEANTD